jgi:uncharacterized protein
MSTKKLIWFDAATPKYALFFSYLIPVIEDCGYRTVITTRYSANYEEAKAMLDLRGVNYEVIGNYGGSSIGDKFISRLNRQEDFIKLFAREGQPDALICGSVVDSIQTAFGIGIPVINFCDTPLIGSEFSYDKITIVTKLTLMLSSLVFYPFVIPGDIFSKMGVGENKLIKHDFLDVHLWMSQVKRDEKNDFRKDFGLDLSKKTILIREEEYKAHYVSEQLPIIYDVIDVLSMRNDINVVVLPRYGAEVLRERVGEGVIVLDRKLSPKQFYPFIDLLIGGGGTMNLEAAYLGIPVISTRSLFLYQDKFLFDNNLMVWSDTVEGVLELLDKHLGQKNDNAHFFNRLDHPLQFLVDKIDDYLSQESN